MKKTKLSFVAIATLLALTACGGGSSQSSGGSVTPSSIVPSSSQSESSVSKKVESITISLETTTLKKGDEVTAKVGISPSDATNKDHVFSSSNENVATVDSTGKVTCVGAGSAVIKVTLTDGTKSAEISITVEDANPHKNLTVTQMADYLMNTPYAISDLEGKEKFGLSEPGKVGVTEDSSVVYEEIPDSKYLEGYVIDFSKITIADIQQYYPEVSAPNDTYILKTCLNKAKDLSDGENLIKIKLPERTLDINGSASGGERVITLDGVDNLAIIGNNTVFNVIYNNLNWNGWLSLTNCKNFAMKGCILDNEIPSSISGVIKTMNVDNRTSTIDIDPSYNNVIEALQTNKKPMKVYMEFDQYTRTPLMNGNLVDRGAFEGYTINGDAATGYQMVVTFQGNINRSPNKSLVAISFSEYDVSGININACENVYLEDLTMYRTPGMGVVATKVNGLYLNRTSIMLEPDSKDLLTCTADGMHFVNCHGNVQVSNCIVENTHDDALNIKHGYWYTCTSPENVTIDSKMYGQCVISCTTEVEAPQVGDKVGIFEKATFESHNPSNDYFTIAEVTKAAAGYKVRFTKKFSNVADWGGKELRATLVNNTPNFIYKNNIVRNKRNRGILVQVPNGLVENNTFLNVGHGSIQCANAMDIYNECTIPNGVTIRNNKFIHNIYLGPEPLQGDISVFAIGDKGVVAPKGTVNGVTIENNFITRNGNAATSLRGVGKTTVKDNLFYECCENVDENNKNLNTLINANNCETITVSGNYNHYTLDKGMSGIYLQGLTEQKDFTLSDNVNVEFYKSSEEGPKIDVSRATGAIKFDGDISEWKNIGATPIEFLAASEATGAEHEIASLEDHFKIKEAYITSTADGIAMGFDIFDNAIKVDPQAGFWTGDCIEILLTDVLTMPAADTQVYKEQGGVAQIAFAPTWSASNYCTITQVRSNSKYLGKEAQLTVGCQMTADGYCMEILLPYSVFGELKTTVDAGNRIAMAIVVADSSRKESIGIERIQIGNVPHFVETYKTMSERMPQYLFK